MKKRFLILIIALLCSGFTVSAQSDNIEINYRFINEYGAFFGGGSDQTITGFTGVFINGVDINKTNFFGIGLGYESDAFASQSIPVFLNFRHIFPSSKVLKPLVNIAIGTRFSFWSEDQIIGYDPFYLYPIYGDPIQKYAIGIYSTVATGFNVHAFSFTSGLFFKSVGPKFFAGIEVKCGFSL